MKISLATCLLVFCSSSQAGLLDQVSGYYLIQSSGEAAQHQSIRMGRYNATGDYVEGYLVFENNGQYLYVNKNGFWTVGTNTSSRAGGLYHPEHDPTPKIPPVIGWRYSNNGWHDDSNLTVRHISVDKLKTGNQEIMDKLTMLENKIANLENKNGPLKPTLPIGSIMAWVNKVSALGPTLNVPEGWVRCDGSSIPDLSIWAGQYTPNLNNEKRFLRGGDDRNVLTMEEDQLQDHKHTVNDPGHTHGYNDKYGLADRGKLGWKWSHGTYDASHWKTTSSSQTGITMGQVTRSYRTGSETRPKNMNVIYIMRVW